MKFLLGEQEKIGTLGNLEPSLAPILSSVFSEVLINFRGKLRIF